MKLTLEVNPEFIEDGMQVAEGTLAPAGTFVINGAAIIATPKIEESYWQYRVKLGDSGQAIVGFPKFFTIGIGFAQEKKDWNTNLPYSCAAKEILEHIKINKGDNSISDDDCLRAIQMVKRAAKKWTDFQKHGEDEKILLAEPLLRNKKGKLMSPSEFSKACLVHEQRYRSGYDVVFGLDPKTLQWKYRFELFHNGDKKRSMLMLHSFLVRRVMGINEHDFHLGVRNYSDHYNSDRMPFLIQGRKKKEAHQKKMESLLSEA